MNGGENIPIDLFLEIFSRLPAKSTARFRCVSKLWESMLRRPYFTELFLTRFSARPRLLFAAVRDGEYSFFSLPQSQNPCENKLSPIVGADFHTKFSKGISEYDCSYASGLIYFHNMCIPREDEDKKRVICNPTTGQYVILPELRKHFMSYSYLGFDPIDKEFKVLLMKTSGYIAYNDTDHHILTLGTGKMRWRKIQCPFNHEPFWERICINGVLYYKAQKFDGRSYAIVCFDVRSEKFKFIEANFCNVFTQLINYKGKLGVVNLKNVNDGTWLRDTLEFRMWVLEHVEKMEWSEYVYTLFDSNEAADDLVVVGMTATGDIILSKIDTCEPIYVFFFNPERNTFQSVEIQGFGANRDCRVYPFVDYVDDLSFNHAKQLKSSPVKQGLNIITKSPKPKQLRHTSRDVCNSAPSVKDKSHVKDKQQNKYKLLSLCWLSYFIFCVFVFFSFMILLT